MHAQSIFRFYKIEELTLKAIFCGIVGVGGGKNKGDWKASPGVGARFYSRTQEEDRREGAPPPPAVSQTFS